MYKSDWSLVLAAILGLMLTIPVQGCGLKSDPVPGRIEPLNPITDIRLQREVEGILIRWVVQEQPRAMTRFRIMRSESGTDGRSCLGCPPDEVRIADLAAGEANLVKTKSNIFGYLDGDVMPGRIYRYRVIGCDKAGFCSEPSAPLALSIPADAGLR